MQHRRDLFKAAAGLGSAAVLGAAAPATAVAGTTPQSPRRLREEMRKVLGLMPERPRPEFRILESAGVPGGRRDKIEFLAERGDPLLRTPDDVIRAYLFVPDHSPGAKLPAIVAIHQDGPQSHIGKAEPAGLAGDATLFYGLELFQRGYVVICPDRYYHAERRRVTPNDLTSVDPQRDERLMEHWAGQLVLRGRSGLGKEAYDLMLTTDVLASLPFVDRGRMGWIGHSAGGLAGVYFMFLDPRLKAGVSSCGVFGFAEFFREDGPRRRSASSALPGLLNVGDSGDVLALISPRPVLLTRGMWEWGRGDEWGPFSERHVADTREMEAKARRAYGDGPDSPFKAIYFDEEGGNHALPPGVKREVYAWLDRQLEHRPA